MTRAPDMPFRRRNREVAPRMDGYLPSLSKSGDASLRSYNEDHEYRDVAAVRSRSERVAIIVLGAGRSGTSALTRVVSLLGATLPRDLLSPSPGNESGYWEPERLLAFNAMILERHGLSWCSMTPPPAAWYESSEGKRAVRRASALIAEQYGSAALIVIKDPRVCLLGPLLFRALRRLGIAPRILLPLRHPGEVACSYRCREHLGLAYGELLWASHMIEAEAASRCYPRHWMTYDGLLADWRSTARGIATDFDIEWRVPFDVAAPSIDSFLSPRLRHFDVRDNVAPDSVGHLARDVWLAARAGLAGDEVTLRAGFAAARVRLPSEIQRLEARHGNVEARVRAMGRSRGVALTRPARCARLPRWIKRWLS